MQNGITGCNAAIAAAYKEMTLICRTRDVTKSYLYFFRAKDAGRIKVWTILNIMDYAAKASFIRYNRNLGRQDVAAAAQIPASGWSEKSVRQMLDKGESIVKIDDGFYHAEMTTEAQTSALVHALSHLVGNTEDVDCPWDGETAYGPDSACHLARLDPDLAIQNADNYGWYVMHAARPVAPAADGMDDAALEAVGSSANRESSHPSVSEIIVTKEMGVATNPLLEEALGGAKNNEVQISYCSTGKGELKELLGNVLTKTAVAGYTVTSSSDRPVESLTLNFTKLEIKYRSLNIDLRGNPASTTYNLGTRVLNG